MWLKNKRKRRNVKGENIFAFFAGCYIVFDITRQWFIPEWDPVH